MNMVPTRPLLRTSLVWTLFTGTLVAEAPIHVAPLARDNYLLWWAEWEQGGVRYRLSVKGAPGTAVCAGVGPGRNPADRVPLVIVRRHGKQTVYDCTHEFGGK